MNLAPPQLRTISQRTLEAMSLDRLRQAIILGEIEPGIQVNPAMLADELGVSRGTIRSALSKLEEEGLVTNVVHHGSFINDINKQTVRDVYDLRESLETYAVLHAIPNCTKEDIISLKNDLAKLIEISNEPVVDVQQMIQYDLDLHNFYIKRCGNIVLQQIWSSLEVRIRWLLTYRYSHIPFYKDMADSHLSLVKYTEEKQIDEAVEVMREHIREAREDILTRWNEGRQESVAAKD